jgi:predicted amidohydrolase YtcJ
MVVSDERAELPAGGDLLVTGDVLTMDPARSRAQALAARDGRLLAVGTIDEARAACRPGTPARPLPGTIVPGLIDAHLHMQWAGLKTLRLLGPEPAPLDDLLAALDDDAFSLPWLDGEPTLEQRLHGLRLIQPALHALGLTSIIDPAVTATELAAYQESHRRGELTMRVSPMPHPDLADGADAAITGLAAIGVSTGFGDDRLRLGGVKVYFDGQGRGGTALLSEPWPNGPTPGYRGEQRVSTEDFTKIAVFCATARWSLGVHVVGEGGMDAVLTAFETADAAAPIADLRFQLIHAYLEPSAETMARAARLGVVVSAQPSIQYVNGPALVAQLGERGVHANPLRSWLAAGVRVAGGTDGPDFPLDPRLGLWQARTRRVAGSEAPIGPAEGIDAHAAFSLWTTGAAHAAFADGRRGVLRAGALADFAALSVDPIAATPTALRRAFTHATAIGGTVVHEQDPPQT